jgi:hypothetical protein
MAQKLSDWLRTALTPPRQEILHLQPDTALQGQIRGTESMPQVSRAIKNERDILRRARAAAERGDSIRPLRGEMAAISRLVKRGELIEAGICTMWPHRLFAMPKARS